MDPLCEQRLRDEVIFLHSLWHRGPPIAAARHHLPPSQPTQFKKRKPPQNRYPNSAAQSNPSPGLEWPCPTPSSPPASWPIIPPQTPQLTPLSPEEQLKLDGIRAQKKAFKVVHDFFARNHVDDSDDMNISSDDDDDEDQLKEGYSDRSFFSRVLKEDTKLREYYEKDFVNGEFNCLVCGALGGKNTTKKFKGCLALVQHSITINSLKKRAHRAFGEAVCEVLGWDVDNLPAVVAMLSKLGEEKCSSGYKEDNLEGKNEEAPSETRNMETGIGDVGNEAQCSIGNKDENLDGKNDEAPPETGNMHPGIGDERNEAQCSSGNKDDNLDGKKDEAPLGTGNMHPGIGDEGNEAQCSSGDKDDNLDGKNDEAPPGTGSMEPEIFPHGDEGNKAMFSKFDAVKNLEDCAVECNMVEGASNTLAIGSVSDEHKDSVNNEALEGKRKIGEAALESSGYVGSGIALCGDEGSINSTTSPNAGKSLEDCGVLHRQNSEDRALDGLTISAP